MSRGGRRPGAGRKTNAARYAAIMKAAGETLARLEGGPDPWGTLHEILAFHITEFKTALVKHKAGFLDSKNLREHAQGVRATIEQIAQYRRAFPNQAADRPSAVIRAPELCTTAEAWAEKYAPKSDGSEPQKPAASPEVKRLLDFAIAATDSPPSPVRLVVDNDPQPPMREQSSAPGWGPHEYGPLGPAQIEDLKRRGRL